MRTIIGLVVAAEYTQKGVDSLAKLTLAAVRVNANYTQEKLADELGVSRKMVADWEAGKAEMRPAYLMAICYLTGFSVDDILLPERSAKSEQEE